MVRRVIAILLLCGAATASAVSLKDLVARISAAAVSGWTPGPIGGAVDLNGSSEHFTDFSSYTLNAATQFTVGVWTKKSSNTQYDGLLLSRSPVGNAANGFTSAGQYHSGGAPSILFIWAKDQFDAYYTLNTASNSTVTGTWCFVVGTFDKNTRASLYLNGDRKATTTNAGSLNFSIVDNGKFQIGFDGSSYSDRHWPGLVDESFVFKNRALTSNDVVELYNSGLGKPVTSLSTGTNGLVRYWKLDDGLLNSSATQALDTVSGTYATGTGIGSGDWTNGIVPQ